MPGFISPHPIFKAGVPHDAARGHGPVPFQVGVPSAAPDTGLGTGPIPFQVGVPSEVAAEIGLWVGPLPFILGKSIVVSPETPPGDVVTYTGGAMGHRPFYKPLDEDELIEFIEAVVASGLLE